jgi:hypothetical protein
LTITARRSPSRSSARKSFEELHVDPPLVDRVEARLHLDEPPAVVHAWEGARDCDAPDPRVGLQSLDELPLDSRHMRLAGGVGARVERCDRHRQPDARREVLLHRERRLGAAQQRAADTVRHAHREADQGHGYRHVRDDQDRREAAESDAPAPGPSSLEAVLDRSAGDPQRREERSSGRADDGQCERGEPRLPREPEVEPERHLRLQRRDHGV